VTPATSSYSYFPYARSGLATAITAGPDPGQTRPSVMISLALNDGDQVSVPIELYAAGDIKRLDGAQIVRTDPTPGTANHPPYYFPLIEFDRPELPWAFTPVPVTAASGATGARIQPWLTLVVVEADKATLTTDPAGLLPPTLSAPLSELPPSLDDAWAWAHVQAVGTVAAAGLEAVNDAAPETVVSRLLCPRQLTADTAYVACVVPTYADGADIGLGQTPKGSLDPAWPRDSQDPVTLPVYHSWSFATGSDGDFESLARRLTAVASPGQAGSRALDATTPGAGLPSAGAMRLQGAMSPTNPDFGPGPLAAFANALEQQLDAPAGSDPAWAPVLSPPIYGRWPARVNALPRAALRQRIASWLRELNLDPRHRAAAEFGALVVRRQADALMTSAWRQLGDLQLANQALRQSQLARAGGTSIHVGRLQPRAAAAVLALSAPAHARVALPDAEQTAAARTVTAKLAAGSLGTVAVGPAMRRLLRPGGPLARRFDPSGALRIDGVIAALAAARTALVPPRTAPQGTQTASFISTLTSAGVGALQHGDVTVTIAGAKGDKQTATVVWSSLQPAFAASQGQITGLLSHPDPPPPPPTDLADLSGTVLAGLHPDTTVAARVSQRLTVTDPAWKPADPLEPMLAAPDFPTPLWQSLRAISQQLIAPGLQEIGPETVTVLQTNTRFVNAFMVGANHELARQLVWRHFPTDQRATYFRQFWDPSAAVPDAGGALPDLHDMPPIDTWNPRTDLQQVAGSQTADLLVLVVRGELLRRFPNASVFAVPSDGKTPPGPVFPDPTGDPDAGTATEHYPRFQGRLEPDLTFFGFELTAADANQWFFVLQQHPTEPRYGLEPADPADQPAGDWAEFSWTNLAGGDPSSLRAAGGAVYAPATAPAAAQFPTDTGGLTWGHDAATMAAIVLRDPFRIAIYADPMVNPT
jgi:hypothetical protein